MIQEAVSISSVRNGLCCVYVPHTTAGLTINENADPDVKSDILMTLQDIVSESPPLPPRRRELPCPCQGQYDGLLPHSTHPQRGTGSWDLAGYLLL